MSPLDRSERWQRERAHFDAQADAAAGSFTAFDDKTLSRYRDPQLPFSKDFRFGLMGDLRGKRILDVGCNDGENSVLLARLGAEVVGVDISERSIELADQRAAINGVSDTTRFIAAPIETVDLEDNSFDIVWCHSFLHHVLDELPLVLDLLNRWAKPDGMIVMSEPVSSPTMTKLRGLVPMPVDYGTPTERPLTTVEVDTVKASFHQPQSRYFRLLGRLESAFRLPMVRRLGNGRAERFFYRTLARADFALLSMPFTRGLGSIVVLWGQPRR